MTQDSIYNMLFSTGLSWRGKRQPLYLKYQDWASTCKSSQTNQRSEDALYPECGHGDPVRVGGGQVHAHHLRGVHGHFFHFT